MKNASHLTLLLILFPRQSNLRYHLSGDARFLNSGRDKCFLCGGREAPIW